MIMVDELANETLDEFILRLGLQVSDMHLFTRAITHRSVLSEEKTAASNERLEFLGDAILDLVIAEELYLRHNDWTEGQLTKAKAFLVEERALAEQAQRWNIAPLLLISHGEELSGGRNRVALLADAVEALLGAIYLDQGFEICRDFIRREFAEMLNAADKYKQKYDYKTQLQEEFQARYHIAPVYQVAAETGPAHQRIFDVEVIFQSQVIGQGSGKSKKAAEQQAAKSALKSALLAGDTLHN